VRGFFNTEGYSYNHAGYSLAETTLMIFNGNAHIHNFIVGGHKELKKSIINNFDGANPEDLIEGLTTEINGTKYYNAICANLDRKFQCLPVVINKIEQTTNFHVYKDSSEPNLTIIPNATAGNFLINLSHLGHIDELEANNAENGGSIITVEKATGIHTIHVASLDETQVGEYISDNESTPYICSNLVGVCTLDGASA
jgi:hypothetical protein